MIDFSQLQGKTVLITGGAGFLGSHLTNRLLELGANIVIMDNFSTGKTSNLLAVIPEWEHAVAFSSVDLLQKLPQERFLSTTLSGRFSGQSFTVFAGDVCEKTDIDFLFQAHKILFQAKKIDYVFHWAAVVGVKRTIEQPLLVLRDLEGIRFMLDACVANKVEKMVFSSSSEVYGDPLQLPEYEAGAVNAKMPYAVVKLMGELLLETYFKELGLRTTALRFFNVYGPRQESSDYGFVGAVFVNQVLNGKAPTIFGDGSDTRDFVYVADNVEACIRAMLSKDADGEVINIGTGRPTTILDLAEKVIHLAGADLTPAFLPVRSVEVHHRWPNIMKMRKLLEFSPKISLEEGLQLTIEQMRKKA